MRAPRSAIAAALIAVLVTPSAGFTAGAQDPDPDVYPSTVPSLPTELGFSAVVPFCQSDVPYLGLTIEPRGFEPSQPVTVGITMIDVNGDVYDTVTLIDPTSTREEGLSVDPETGSITAYVLYPGAAVDENGNGTDWPGWTPVGSGMWEEDPSDAYLRDGLRLRVEINPTAVVDVEYPPDTAACANPPDYGVADRTPSEVGAQVPSGQLPQTGASSGRPILQIAALTLALGLLAFAAARRRPAR